MRRVNMGSDAGARAGVYFWGLCDLNGAEINVWLPETQITMTFPARSINTSGSPVKTNGPIDRLNLSVTICQLGCNY